MSLTSASSGPCNALLNQQLLCALKRQDQLWPVQMGEYDRIKEYTKNNQPAILPREIYYRVREEMTRRASKRKVIQKSGKTEQGKYSVKYALSELLICGECGTPYKRCTWARNGKKRIVWRCIS